MYINFQVQTQQMFIVDWKAQRGKSIGQRSRRWQLVEFLGKVYDRNTTCGGIGAKHGLNIG